MNMTSDVTLVCKGCDRGIDACAFCDEEDCGDAICYRCMVVELGETIAGPHEHGG